jgi:hypothetical protein
MMTSYIVECLRQRGQAVAGIILGSHIVSWWPTGRTFVCRGRRAPFWSWRWTVGWFASVVETDPTFGTYAIPRWRGARRGRTDPP